MMKLWQLRWCARYLWRITLNLEFLLEADQSKNSFSWSHNKQVPRQVLFPVFCRESYINNPITNSNWTLYPALAPAVSRLWQQLALELSNHGLIKRRESRGNQWSPGKNIWLIPHSHQNVHPRFPDNDIAEERPSPLLKQVKFRCVNLGESNGAQILLIWISWSGSEGERIGQFWRIMGPLMNIKVFNTNSIRFVLVFSHINMNGIMMKSFFEVS